MKIVVDTQELVRKANDIGMLSNALIDNVRNIEFVISEVGIEWQGDSQVVFTSKFLDVKKEYQIMIDFIKDYSYYLKSVAKEYEENEKEIMKSLEV